MDQSITSAAVAKVARHLENLLDEIRESSPEYAAEMRHRFMLDVHDAVDRLDAIARAGTLPPIAGGAPDDFEELAVEFVADPQGWPDSFDADLDAVFYNLAPDFDGPTPLSVLADEVPFDGSHDAWLSRLDAVHDAASLWSEADQVRAFGCV